MGTGAGVVLSGIVFGVVLVGVVIGVDAVVAVIDDADVIGVARGGRSEGKAYTPAPDPLTVDAPATSPGSGSRLPLPSFSVSLPDSQSKASS